MAIGLCVEKVRALFTTVKVLPDEKNCCKLPVVAAAVFSTFAVVAGMPGSVWLELPVP